MHAPPPGLFHCVLIALCHLHIPITVSRCSLSFPVLFSVSGCLWGGRHSEVAREEDRGGKIAMTLGQTFVKSGKTDQNRVI